MAFRDNAYATIWEVKPTHGKSMNVRLSTSYKNKQTGNYETDFSDYVFFSGEAAQKIAGAKEKDRVKLLQTSVTSQWDKEKKTNRYTFVVWDVDTSVGAPGGGGEQRPQSVVPPKGPSPAAETDELPF
jgi:hypothetical protein